MKKLIIVIVIILVAGLVWYYYGAGMVPKQDEALNVESINIEDDTTTAISEDLDALDLTDLESELDSLDAELENL